MKCFFKSSLPRMAYVADFIPSNFGGGATLLSRLLEKYPCEKLVVISSATYEKKSPCEGRLGCPHMILPTTNKTGRWGWGRLKGLFDGLMIFLYLPVVVACICRHQSKIILTVAHGQFFVLAWLAALVTRRTLVVIVHDEFVTGRSLVFLPFKKIEEWFFSQALNRAQKVYSVSPAMQKMIHKRYHKEAVLQLPAVNPNVEASCPSHMGYKNELAKRTIRIAFTGSINNLCSDNIKILERLLLEGEMEKRGVRFDIELHLYCGIQKIKTKQYEYKYSVFYHEWSRQEEIRTILATADVLFLPHSFRGSESVLSSTSLPTKISDYLAAGKPILVSAPKESALYQYLDEYKLGWFATMPTSDSHVEALIKILSKPEDRLSFYQKALALFDLNHNLIYQQDAFYRDMEMISNRRYHE